MVGNGDTAGFNSRGMLVVSPRFSPRGAGVTVDSSERVGLVFCLDIMDKMKKLLFKEFFYNS